MAADDRAGLTRAHPPAAAWWADRVTAAAARAQPTLSSSLFPRGAVIIDKAMMEQDGFGVIHETSADGKPVAPGSIGYAPVVKAFTAQ